MCQRFKEWEEEIRKYCEKYDLSFDKACKSVQCSNADMLVLQHYEEKTEENEGWVHDETPLPVTLWITKKGDQLIFEQTEHTKKYLAK